MAPSPSSRKTKATAWATGLCQAKALHKALVTSWQLESQWIPMDSRQPNASSKGSAPIAPSRRAPCRSCLRMAVPQPCKREFTYVFHALFIPDQVVWPGADSVFDSCTMRSPLMSQSRSRNICRVAQRAVPWPCLVLHSLRSLAAPSMPLPSSTQLQMESSRPATISRTTVGLE
jgi:hypothetical protein